MGRHSAARSHGPVVVLATAAVIGSAGLAWAVGNGPSGPASPAVRSPATSTVVGGAPTPTGTTSPVPLVVVVPATTPPGTVPGTSGAPIATTPAPSATREPLPVPTRTKPGNGVVPTPRPTKSHK